MKDKDNNPTITQHYRVIRLIDSVTFVYPGTAGARAPVVVEKFGAELRCAPAQYHHGVKLLSGRRERYKYPPQNVAKCERHLVGFYNHAESERRKRTGRRMSRPRCVRMEGAGRSSGGVLA